MKKWLYNLLALGIGIVLSLLLAEIVLRIYNPFQSRVRGQEIVLPANVKYEFNDIHISGLDAHIVHTKNSMGFRGPELPSDKNVFKIFCVGGSTTECFYLSDGQDWPALVMKNLEKTGKKVWVNNAGLDGHSTRGHLILLRDHLLKFKPNMVIFLVGCNDVASDGLNNYEQYHLQNKKRFLENFEVFNAYLSWKRSRAAKNMGMGHSAVDLRTWPIADTAHWEKEVNQYKNKEKNKIKLQQYFMRLETLAEMCRKAGATPVFVTQPTLLGPGIEPVSGRYLGNVKFQENSALYYKGILTAYNQINSGVNRANATYFSIDASSNLESTTNHYYDFFHYTKQGSAQMAQIISTALIQNKWIP